MWLPFYHIVFRLQTMVGVSGLKVLLLCILAEATSGKVQRENKQTIIISAVVAIVVVVILIILILMWRKLNGPCNICAEPINVLPDGFYTEYPRPKYTDTTDNIPQINK